MSYNPWGGTAVCVHGVGWAAPCASCGRGYPSSGPAVINNFVDLEPVLQRLDRIEGLLRELVARSGEATTVTERTDST